MCLKDICTQDDIDSKIFPLFSLGYLLFMMLTPSSAGAASLHKQVCGTDPK